MDPIQILGSLTAILLLAFIAMRMFPVKATLDESKVTRNLLRYEPDAEITDIYLTGDRRAALSRLDAPEHSLGLTVQLGDRVVCRILGGRDIKHAGVKAGELVIRFDDYTQPSVKLSYSAETLPKVYSLVNHIAAAATDKGTSHAA